jgi:glycosyltransferase involved in cell wall biosynthesis
MSDVVFIINSMGQGGAQRSVFVLSKEMADRGLQVSILTTDPIPSEYSFPSNVKLYPLFPLNFGNNIFTKVALFPYILLKIIVFLRRKRPKYCCSLLTRSNIFLILSKPFLRKMKIVISERNVTSNIYSSGLSSRIMRAIIKITYNYSDKVICISKAVKMDLKFFGVDEGKLKVIYNPVFIEKQEKSQKNNQFTFVCVSRLIKLKDVSTIIRAFALLCKNREARLVVIGDGPEYARLNQEAEDLGILYKVSFLGWIHNVNYEMKKCHVFISASEHEGFGNVIIEAMSCSLPVISSRCPGGPVEILEHGKYGELFSIGNVRELEEIMTSFCDNKFLLNKYSELSGYRATCFRSDHIADLYLEEILCGE